MQIKGLIEYTRGQLENMARDILRRRPDVDFTPRINVELLIENTPNVSLEIMDNLIPSYSIEGCVCKQEFMGRQLTVFVDNGVFDGGWARYNAVLGEEFAHIALHMALIHQVQSVEDFIAIQRDPEWGRLERDAKYLSAAIRMPAELVVPEAELAYQRVVREHDFGDAPKIEKFLRDSLAETFRVPPADMRRRMMDWPCNISRRCAVSVLGVSGVLVPASWELTAMPVQRKLLPEVQ